MTIQIFWDSLESTPENTDLITEKFKKLEKYLKSFKEEMTHASVTIKKRPRWGYRVKFDMQLPSEHIFAEDVSDDLTASIINTREKAERQIKHYLDKLKSVA